MPTFQIRYLHLFAFEIPLLNKMEQRYVGHLFMPYLITLICSCFLIAISAAYIVLMVPHISYLRYLAAAIIFSTVFVFMFNLERLFVALGAYPLESSIADIDKWAPDGIQKICLGVLGIVFAAPILMLINKGVIDSNINTLSTAKAEVYQTSELQRSMDRQSDLLRNKVTLLEQIDRNQSIQNGLLPNERKNDKPSLNKDTQQNTLSPSVNKHRKALVIGMQNYPGKLKLKYTLNDSRSIKTELEKMGFQVTLSEDESVDQLRITINTYIKSLESGVDYSIVYYAGHGFQIKDQNYIAAVDLKMTSSKELEESSVNIAQILQGISLKKPRLNMIILDSCRDFYGQELTGLAPFQINDQANDYILYTATEPGRKSREDPKLKHGIFTYALLQHLALPESIFSIMTRVTSQVKDMSAKLINADAYCKDHVFDDPLTCSIQHPEFKTNATKADHILLAEGYPNAFNKNMLKKTNKKETITPIVKPDDVASLNDFPVNLALAEEQASQGCSKYKTLNLRGPQSLYINCMNAELLLLDKKLKEEDELQKFGLDIKKQWYQQALVNSGMIDERIHNMFLASNYIQEPKADQPYIKRYLPLLTATLNVTLFWGIAALLYSGIWFRYSDKAVQARREYEKLRYLQSRQAIAEMHHQTSVKVEDLMSKYRVYSEDTLPKLNLWDEELDFYKEEKPKNLNPSTNLIDTKEKFDDFISELTPTV